MSRTRKPATVRSEVVWTVVWLVAFTAIVLVTSDPANRIRDLMIFVPIAAAVSVAGSWFRLRATRRNRAPERPDYRFTRD
jgi:hypothetical protein